MKKIGFVFHSSPHSSSAGREGLDAVLAASAYCDAISLFFVGFGVTQIVANQSPQQLLSRDYISAFKLLELYDIEHLYLCEQSVEELGLASAQWVIDVKKKSPQQIAQLLHECDQVLTF